MGWQHDLGVFPVDYVAQGDEWHHHLARALPGRAGGGRTTHTGQVRVSHFSEAGQATMLLVDQHSDGILCTLQGHGEAPAPGELDEWRGGIEHAVAQLGHGNTDFAWEAIVGPDISLLGPLPDIVQVGPIQLRPGGVCMRETRFSRLDFNGPFIPTYTYPLIAAGTVSAYSWTPGFREAQRQVRRICALLTLTHPIVCWIPRSQPQHLQPDAEGLRVPTETGYWHELGDPDRPGPWTGEALDGAVPLELPAWLLRAWRAVDVDPGLDRAVDAAYEAVRLERDHPSAAHLAYVAAIEGYGERYADSAPCDCCENCPAEKGVAQARFKEALRRAGVSSKERRRLHQAYGLRSRTGHTGAMFGTEDSFGFPHMDLFAPGAGTQFTHHHLRRLRHAARTVLRHAIEQPGRGSAP